LEQITLRIPNNTLTSLERNQTNTGVSRSERILNLLRNRSKHAADMLRVRELEDRLQERDKWHARYNESQGKLKVHNSEIDSSKGFFARLLG